MDPEQRPPQVGKNIQKVRKEKRLTLGHLSQVSGVSKAMLSQIETEKVNPTIATIWKIAQGLQISLNTLLKSNNDEGRRFHVSRSEHITSLDAEEEGVHIKVLSPFSMVEDLEIYLVSLAAGGVLHSQSHIPKTEEFVTVISGSVRVNAGTNMGELHKGDFVSYHSDVKHSIENIGSGEAIVHMVVRFHHPR